MTIHYVCSKCKRIGISKDYKPILNPDVCKYCGSKEFD